MWIGFKYHVHFICFDMSVPRTRCYTYTYQNVIFVKIHEIWNRSLGGQRVIHKRGNKFFLKFIE